MNQQLQATLAEILKAMQNAAVEYGPRALDLTLTIKRLEGAQELLTALAGLVLLIFSVKKLRRAFTPTPPMPETKREELEAALQEWYRTHKDNWNARYHYEKLQGYGFFKEMVEGNKDPMNNPEIFWTLPAALGAWFALGLLNIWSWAALFAPGLAFAHEILRRVLN